MTLLVTIVVAAVAAAWVVRDKLHWAAAAGSSAAAAGGVAWWLSGCAWAADVDSVQLLVGSAATVVIGVGIAMGVASIRSGDAGSMAQLRTGTFNLSWVWPFALLAPTMLILAVFLYLPALQTFGLSTKLVRLGAPRTADVCLANFSGLLVDDPLLVAGLPLLAIALVAGVALLRTRSEPGSVAERVALALGPIASAVVLVALYFVFAPGRTGYRAIYVNTVVVSVGTVALSMSSGLALAMLAVRRIRGAVVYRTLLVWPYAVSTPVAGILFFMMFDSTAGVLNHLFDLVNVPFPNYRGDPSLARFAVILASAWKQVGYNILFYLAGLQMVPREQVEAAALDGANAWQRFRHIVVPSVAPITFFLLVTNLTYAFFEVYGTIDYLTRGGPAGATTVAIYEIIRVGVDNGDIGRGAAQSVLLFIAVIGLTVWQFRRSEGRITYGGA